MTDKKTLFDELYTQTNEDKRTQKKPLVRSQIKRKLSSARDEAENNKINAEAKVQELVGNFENFDVNEILKQELIIKKATELQEMTAAQYVKLFGVAMPKNE